MIRTLVTGVLITAALIHFVDTPPETAVGYAITICAAAWLFWPLLRRVNRLRRHLTRRRRRHTRPATRRAPLQTVSPPTTLTQINHYHYYGHAGPPAAAPNPNQLAIPQYSDQQIAHNAIFDTFDDV